MFNVDKHIATSLISGTEGKVKWSSPSNIALVKYWGKRKNQIPENPNLSFSLEEARTITGIKYRVKKESELSWEFSFEGNRVPGFEPKLKYFFDTVIAYVPYLNRLHFEISSTNTFPHSTGIASSASAMSAMALNILDIGNRLNVENDDPELFFRKASFLARLGSGSASRSVFPGFSVWGSTDMIKGSSDEYASELKLEEGSYFNDIRDAILIVSSEKKDISSSLGHNLMKTNPYATFRYQHARENLHHLIRAIEREDKEAFIRITENEALTLHGLMMSSEPGYILLKRGSIEIIRKIREFRKTSGLFVTFTLDAGPNVHLLYHAKDHSLINTFVENELAGYLENRKIIWDRLGNGPLKIPVE